LPEADSLATLHALMGVPSLQPSGAAENGEDGLP
jgi:hypothetical protein